MIYSASLLNWDYSFLNYASVVHLDVLQHSNKKNIYTKSCFSWKYYSFSKIVSFVAQKDKYLLVGLAFCIALFRNKTSARLSERWNAASLVNDSHEMYISFYKCVSA